MALKVWAVNDSVRGSQGLVELVLTWLSNSGVVLRGNKAGRILVIGFEIGTSGWDAGC